VTFRFPVFDAKTIPSAVRRAANQNQSIAGGNRTSSYPMVYRFAAGLRTQSPRRLAAKYQFAAQKEPAGWQALSVFYD